MCCAVQVVEDVLALNGIARHLKSGRADNGALRLDNTKLFFKMDEHGNPVSAGPYGEPCFAPNSSSPTVLDVSVLLGNLNVLLFDSSHHAFQSLPPSCAVLSTHQASRDCNCHTAEMLMLLPSIQ